MSQLNTTQQFILVVEDDGDVKPDIRAALAFYGYEVLDVQDGDATQGSVGRRQENLLSDVYMDGIDGLQFLKAVQAVEQWYDIPVILVSAIMGGFDKWRSVGGALKTNQVAYLAKPTQIQDLFANFHHLSQWSQSPAFASV